MVDWPASLPQKPQLNGYKPTRRRKTRDFVPDQGRRISRVIQSDAGVLWSGTYWMTEAQQATFWDFWENDINFGLDTFTITDPSADATVTAQFQDTAPPEFNAIGYDLYEVALRFEVIA